MQWNPYNAALFIGAYQRYLHIVRYWYRDYRPWAFINSGDVSAAVEAYATADEADADLVAKRVIALSALRSFAMGNGGRGVACLNTLSISG